jgi:hypothetical protein
MEQHPREMEQDGGIASAEQGEVMLDGPDGVAVSMTPDAAVDTASSLNAAAKRARGQQHDEKAEDGKA